MVHHIRHTPTSGIYPTDKLGICRSHYMVFCLSVFSNFPRYKLYAESISMVNQLVQVPWYLLTIQESYSYSFSTGINVLFESTFVSDRSRQRSRLKMSGKIEVNVTSSPAPCSLGGKLGQGSQLISFLCVLCQYPVMEPLQCSCGDRVCSTCYDSLLAK